jgi:death-on-curing family protein
VDQDDDVVNVYLQASRDGAAAKRFREFRVSLMVSQALIFFKKRESSLARPQNLASYESEATLCDPASAYAFGIAKKHPFLDRNKRVAFYASVGFLRINGKNLKASEVDAAGTFLDVAAGAITEEELAGWFKRNC